MRVFLDTNILLDLICESEPHYQSALDVLDSCDRLGASVYLAWHTLSNAFYIISKTHDRTLALKALEEALDLMEIVTTGHADARQAFSYGMTDLEDALQVAAAAAAKADFLITRDTTGFRVSPVSVISPSEFAQQFAAP